MPSTEILDCPNNCKGKFLTREKLDNHAKKCPMAPQVDGKNDKQQGRATRHRVEKCQTAAAPAANVGNRKPKKKMACRQCSPHRKFASKHGLNIHKARMHSLKNEEDEDDVVVVAEKKSRDADLQLIPHKGQTDAGSSGGFGRDSAIVSHYAGMIINACAHSNLVTFHDVNTVKGTIGKITFQFQCSNCRGALGRARCQLGRAYCINCCGHRQCD